MIVCTKCKQPKTTNSFRPRKGSYTGCQYWCRDCERAAARDRYIPKTREKTENPQRAIAKAEGDSKERRRERILKHRYGISIKEYDIMYQNQNGKCAICNEAKPYGGTIGLYIDHCHNSSKVRGLLCSNCNAGIGKFKESESLLMAAIEYIKKYQPLVQGEKSEQKRKPL